MKLLYSSNIKLLICGFIISCFTTKSSACEALDKVMDRAENVDLAGYKTRENLAVELEKSLLSCVPSELTHVVAAKSETTAVTSAAQIEGVWLSTLLSPAYTGLIVPKTYILTVKAIEEDVVNIRYSVYGAQNSEIGTQAGIPTILIAEARLKLSNGVARAYDFQRSSLDFQSTPARKYIHNLLVTDFEGFTRLGLVSPDMLLTIDTIDAEDEAYARPRTWVRTSQDTLDIMEMFSANSIVNSKRPLLCLNEIIPSERFETEIASYSLSRQALVTFARESREIAADQALLLDPDMVAAEQFGIDFKEFMLETSKRYNDVDPKIIEFLEAQANIQLHDFDPLCPSWLADTIKKMAQ